MSNENGSGGILSEAVYNFRNLRQSFEQRKITTESVETSLLELSDFLPPTNPFLTPAETPTDIIPLSPGFFSSTYKFTSQSGEWVAKMGLPTSPMKGYPHPSSTEFTEWYNKNLALLHENFQEELPHLIPDPQIAVHNAVTTVILQPFIAERRPLKDIAHLSKTERSTIRNELNIFDSGVRKMQKEYGLTPDMLRAKDHFVLSPFQDEYHLVLLDNGLFDDNLDAVGMNTINRLTYHGRISLEKLKLLR